MAAFPLNVRVGLPTSIGRNREWPQMASAALVFCQRGVFRSNCNWCLIVLGDGLRTNKSQIFNRHSQASRKHLRLACVSDCQSGRPEFRTVYAKIPRGCGLPERDVKSTFCAEQQSLFQGCRSSTVPQFLYVLQSHRRPLKPLNSSHVQYSRVSALIAGHHLRIALFAVRVTPGSESTVDISSRLERLSLSVCLSEPRKCLETAAGQQS